MPVVINDFEVVVDQPAASSTRSASGGEAPATEAPRGATPHEIELIVQREKERLARVQAH
jgi:hypothetical protein